jgi:hypothetical protein
MKGPGSGLFFSVSALLCAGCVTDHELLAAGSGGTPGAGGGTVIAAGGAASGGAAPLSDGNVAREADVRPDAPPGIRSLTLVHGVIDAETVAFCFAKVDGGAERAVTGSPVPPGGLSYGASIRVSSLSGIELGTDDFRPYVVAAAASELAAEPCSALLATAAGPSRGARDAALDGAADAKTSSEGSADAADAAEPGRLDAAVDGGADSSTGVVGSTDAAPPPIPAVRVRAFPVFLGASLSSPRSYLLVAAGCLGGPGVTDPAERTLCGRNYAPDQPTLDPILVAPGSEARSGRVGLQFLNATPAIGQADLELVAANADPIPLARDVVVGGLRPPAADTSTTAPLLGGGRNAMEVQVFAGGSSVAGYKAPFADVLAAGGLDAVEDGKSYVLVLVGPYLGFSRKKWWNAPLVTAVESAP